MDSETDNKSGCGVKAGVYHRICDDARQLSRMCQHRGPTMIKKRAEGKKHSQAIRALGRQMIRVIWSLVKHQREYEIRTK